jgi:hypothetical protein
MIDGSGETAMFVRPGSALWTHTGRIGRHIALSPVGSKVAFVSKLCPKQMPGELFAEGTMELWDVVAKKQLPSTIVAVDKPISWFPDGKRLAFVRLVERAAVSNNKKSVLSETDIDSWKELPTVHILDVETGRLSFACVGWFPCVARDGKSIFVGSWISDRSAGEGTQAARQRKLRWERLDLATGKSIEVRWPGDAGQPLVANPNDDVVLYWGLPTTGAPIKHSTLGSFKAGIMQVTIKAAVLNSDRFQTVVPEIDPRDHVSFGVLANQ